ncbi:hypothetical protein F4677DRAFT_459535 [Hypoxylon crocopeplum]|nr:hypothetical protein F4677DRAFT_459535 [Hypoxylon crocopeplum]
MEPKNNQGNWLKGKFRSVKNRVSTNLPSPTPGEISAFRPSTGISQSTANPTSSTQAVLNSNDDPVDSPCTSSDHGRVTSGAPSPSTVYQTGNDNHGPSHTSGSSPPTHIEDNAVRTEATTENESTNDLTELLGPNQLWATAYKKLWDDDPRILGAYQRFLLEKGHLQETNGSEPQPGDGDWQGQVQKLAKERLEANQEGRFSFQIGEKDIIVRDQFQKAMGFIVSTKDLMAAAISSEPHAALAWAGVMFIFPLLKTMLQQDKDAIEGFEFILSLLVRCKLMENDFLQPTIGNSDPSDHDYKLALSLQSKTIELYSSVYEYQIRVILHSDRSALNRYLRDLVVSNDWKGMVEKLKATDREMKNDLQGLSNHITTKIDGKLEDFRSKVQEFLERCTRLHEKAIESMKAIDQASHLRDLPVAHSAAFKFSEIEGERRCTEGTRVQILNYLQQWVESPTGKPIVWLHGMAGTGKSTIARTVATAVNENIPFANKARLPGNVSPGATFFFKQDDAERNRAGVLFTTLAHQLAHKRLGLESEIANAIKQHASPSIGKRSLKA